MSLVLGAGVVFVAPQGVASGLFNVKDPTYGAKGDGTTDDTTAIQTAINAAQAVGGTVYLPNGLYKLTAALTVTAGCRIIGEGLTPLYGSITTDFNTINCPVAAPYMTGTVLLQTAGGANGIVITGAGLSVELRDFGIRFADAIKFANTGHGIHYVPPVTTSTYRDNGLSGAMWRNVTVFGHDGSHYAFYLTNAIYNTLTHLRSFGGGALFLENNGDSTQFYGNLQIDHLYAQVFISGTSHGVRLANTASKLNLLLFNRPQITVSNMSSTFVGTTPPTGAQKMFNSDLVKTLCVIAPDFETNVGSTSIIPTDGVDSIYLSPGGLASGNSFNGNWGAVDGGYRMSADFSTMPKNGLTTSMTMQKDAAGANPLSITTDSGGIRTLTLPGPAKLASFTTASRPSAATAGAGANIYDTTLGKPIWSNGVDWKDAAGTTV